MSVSLRSHFVCAPLRLPPVLRSRSPFPRSSSLFASRFVYLMYYAYTSPVSSFPVSSFTPFPRAFVPSLVSRTLGLSFPHSPLPRIPSRVVHAVVDVRVYACPSYAGSHPAPGLRPDGVRCTLHAARCLVFRRQDCADILRLVCRLSCLVFRRRHWNHTAFELEFEAALECGFMRRCVLELGSKLALGLMFARIGVCARGEARGTANLAWEGLGRGIERRGNDLRAPEWCVRTSGYRERTRVCVPLCARSPLTLSLSRLCTRICSSILTC